MTVRETKTEGADILRAELVELLGLSEPHDNHTGIVEEIKVYHQIFEEVSKVYCEATDGKISKPNTYAHEVIDELNAKIDRERDEATQLAIGQLERVTEDRDAVGVDHSALITKLAALTDKWLCQAVTNDRDDLLLCSMAAEVRDLLPKDTRYENG
ncbi:MAG: hypothetical protein RIF41_07785 [Polyangiaceae bacterium]